MSLRRPSVPIPQTVERLSPILPEFKPTNQTVTSDVLVPALKCALGGLCGGIFTERVLVLLNIYERATINYAALSAGLLVFSVAGLILAFRDEIVLWVRNYAEKRNTHDYSELVQKNVDQQQTITIQQAEIDRLAAVDGGSGNGAVILMAYKLLSDYYVNSLPFTQTEVLDRKACSRQVWNLVNGFFRAAKIINGNGGVLIDNLPDAFGAFMQVHTACTHFEKVGGKLVKAPPPVKK